MYHLHQRLFGSYIPFEDFLNRSQFEQLFELKGGLMAKGPKQLLGQYATCLEERGLGWTMVNEYRPRSGTV
jgi:hypothetical protein